MRQLEPIGTRKKGQCKKPAVYADDCPELKDWMNCFVELHRMYCFKDDPE
jgi:hypothetical protein